MDAAFLAAISATMTQPLWLVEIGFTSPMRVATRQTDWNGYTWLADRVLDVKLDSDDGAKTRRATITVGNHDNLLSAYLLNQRIANKPINIWAAWLDGATLHIEQKLAGVGTGGSWGPEVAQLVATGGNAQAHAPRLLTRHLVGWPEPLPEGYVIKGATTTYEFTRR